MGLHLFGHTAFRFRDYRTVGTLRLVVGVVAVAIVPVALVTTALVTLGLLALLFVSLAEYETVRSPYRRRLRSGRSEPRQ